MRCVVRVMTRLKTCPYVGYYKSNMSQNSFNYRVLVIFDRLGDTCFGLSAFQEFTVYSPRN